MQPGGYRREARGGGDRNDVRLNRPPRRAVHKAVNCCTEHVLVSALEEAREADRRLDAGDATGELMGIPISVKDCFFQRGCLATCGTAVRTTDRRDEDGPLIAALREAGAIPLVRTNVPQSLMVPETQNNIWGCTNSPWDEKRSPCVAGAVPYGRRARAYTPLTRHAPPSSLQRWQQRWGGRSCRRPWLTPGPRDRHWGEHSNPGAFLWCGRVQADPTANHPQRLFRSSPRRRERPGGYSARRRAHWPLCGRPRLCHPPMAVGERVPARPDGPAVAVGCGGVREQRAPSYRVRPLGASGPCPRHLTPSRPCQDLRVGSLLPSLTPLSAGGARGGGSTAGRGPRGAACGSAAAS